MPNLKTPKQIELERLRAFPSAPYDRSRPSGVLLSDEIEHYCKYFKLLDPYEPDNIKAANYELRIGYNYSRGGKNFELKKLGEIFDVPPFEVVIMEILETVNMPAFLIGRWNIRVRWAYDGLIWVGGPQVDAGYRGKISCPIWNLSNRTIPLKCGEEIAIIDFVTTTPPTKNSKPYRWDKRSRFLFGDYEPEKLRSALITDVRQDIGKMQSAITDTAASVERNKMKAEELLERNNTRLDTTTSIMFTALGVLVAAIAIFATKTPDSHYWWDPSVFFLCWTTTSLSLLAWVKLGSTQRWSWVTRSLVAVLIVGGIVAQVVFANKQARQVQGTIDELTNRVKTLEVQQRASDHTAEPSTSHSK